MLDQKFHNLESICLVWRHGLVQRIPTYIIKSVGMHYTKLNRIRIWILPRLSNTKKQIFELSKNNFSMVFFALFNKKKLCIKIFWSSYIVGSRSELLIRIWIRLQKTDVDTKHLKNLNFNFKNLRFCHKNGNTIEKKDLLSLKICCFILNCRLVNNYYWLYKNIWEVQYLQGTGTYTMKNEKFRILYVAVHCPGSSAEACL